MARMTFLVATVAFAVFLALHVLTGHATRAFDRASTGTDRARYAMRACLYLYARAVWFAGLFTACAWVVIAAVPAIPWLEVALVYAAIIAIITTLMQATHWLEEARSATDRTATITMDDGRTLTVPPEILAMIDEATPEEDRGA